MATEVATVENSNVSGQKVIFGVHCEKEGVFCSGYEYETVKDAIEKTSGTLPCPVNNYIFWGFVKGHSDEVVINPNLLLCKSLEPSSHVKAEKLPNTCIVPLVEKVNKSDLVSNQTNFFLENPKKYKTNITRIPRNKYMRRNFCVSAVKGESLLDALKKDGRFLNPEKWTLSYLLGKKEKKKVKVLSSTKSQDLAENVILIVTFSPQKRMSTGCSDEESVSKSTTIPKGQGKKKKVEDELDHPSRSQLHQNILKAAKAAAQKKLLSGKKRGRLATLVKKKFSKAIDQSKSAWLVEKLYFASKSVGHLHAESGRVTGTCFLVLEDVILTNYHVFKDIIDDIAALGINSKVKVFFNHMLPIQLNGLGEVEVDVENIVAQSTEKELDYIFLQLKSKCSNQLELGKLTSTVNPKNVSNKTITIIGHPDGREKRIDHDCRILSEHIWRPELLHRIQSLQPLIFDPLFTCKQEIMSENYKNKIAYDSSFSYGASGSPVFDDQGKIIAMHTCGWVVKPAEKGESFSIMEFAVPIEAIYYDCYKRDQRVANMLFPGFCMEVDQ